MKIFRGIVLESGRGILDLLYNLWSVEGNYSIHMSSVFVWGMACLRWAGGEISELSRGRSAVILERITYSSPLYYL